MGFNTVAVIMNDALDMIAKDAEIGANISKAVMLFPSVRTGTRHPVDADVPARAGRGVHCNAITIVSQEHADYPQVVVVSGNCGRALSSGEDPLPGDLEALARVLRDHGWKAAPRRSRRCTGGRNERGLAACAAR